MTASAVRSGRAISLFSVSASRLTVLPSAFPLFSAPLANFRTYQVKKESFLLDSSYGPVLGRPFFTWARKGAKSAKTRPKVRKLKNPPPSRVFPGGRGKNVVVLRAFSSLTAFARKRVRRRADGKHTQVPASP